MQIQEHGPMKISMFKNLQCADMPVHLIGIEHFTPVIQSITNGINGYFLRCLKRVWHTAKIQLLTGVLIAKLCWQMSRL